MFKGQQGAAHSSFSLSPEDIVVNVEDPKTHLGQGSYGIVYHGSYKKMPVAVKQLLVTDLAPRQLEDFQKEVELMASFHYDYIVRLYGFTEVRPYRIVMEYMAKGSLFHMLNSKEELSWTQRVQWGKEIAMGLNYLHTQNPQIIHRDLKSPNVLVNDHNQAKLSDFGSAIASLRTTTATLTKQSKKETQSQALVGSTRWMAPELFTLKRQYSKASDIFAYAIILWEIAARKIPFENVPDDNDIKDGVKAGEREDIQEDWPDIFSTLLPLCWAQDPKQRPDAQSIITELEKVSMAEETPVPAPWHFDSDLKVTLGSHEKYRLIPATGQDFAKVLEFYQVRPVPGYEIGSVQIIYNPKFNRSFALNLEHLQNRAGKEAFKARWSEEEKDPAQLAQRREIDAQWKTLAAPYTDQHYPDIKLLPLWHGTDPKVLASLFETGYANLATTDDGFFGKGLYSTREAEYADRVYSRGALIVNWVATFSAYPVVYNDMLNEDNKPIKMLGKSNYGNYDTHFVPVYPKNSNNPNESVYYACRPRQKAYYTEVVVFDKTQCLPRYLVTLQKSLLKAPPAPVVAPLAAVAASAASSNNAFASEAPIVPASAAKPAANIKKSEESEEKVKAQPKAPSPEKEKVNKVEKTPVTDLFKPTPASKPAVSRADVEKLLLHVARGEQDEAEAMLKVKGNEALLLHKGQVTDYSNRTFKNITAFQYALWALDWHMWKMLKTYLPDAEAAAQLQELETRGTEHGQHYDFSPLMNALKTYVDRFDALYKASNWKELGNLWTIGVGGAQTQVPAHVANEYCRPDRSFDPKPSFTEVNLPRTFDLYEDNKFFPLSKYSWGSLSSDFSIYRGTAAQPVGRARAAGMVACGRPWPSRPGLIFWPFLAYVKSERSSIRRSSRISRRSTWQSLGKSRVNQVFDESL